MEDADVIGSPTQPPSPTDVMTDSATTSMMAKVPLNPPVSSTSISVITTKLAGTRILRSLSDTSMNAWLKIT